MRLYSQNIDGLETSLKSLAPQTQLDSRMQFPKTVLLHGSITEMICNVCRRIKDLDPSLFQGPKTSPCSDCEAANLATDKRTRPVGCMRPRVVLYNDRGIESDSAITEIVNADIASKPDALIVVGTSLSTDSAREIVRDLARAMKLPDSKSVVVWVNTDSQIPSCVPGDLWDFVVTGSCEEVARLVE